MSATPSELGPAGIDPIPPAALFALVAGALAIAYPYFDGLAVALAALLVVSWIVRWPPISLRRGTWLPPRFVAGVLVAGGWVLFLVGPPALEAVRGALLGLAGLPLWLWFRANGTGTSAGGA